MLAASADRPRSPASPGPSAWYPPAGPPATPDPPPPLPLPLLLLLPPLPLSLDLRRASQMSSWLSVKVLLAVSRLFES